MFSLKGETIVQLPLDVLRDRGAAAGLLRRDVLRVVLPEGQRGAGSDYAGRHASFTAASNNFELAIAVAVAHVRHPQRRRVRRGDRPLVEVPV